MGIIGLSVAVLAPQTAEALEPPKPPLGARVADTLADAGDKFVGKMVDRAHDLKGVGKMIDWAQRPKPTPPAAPAPVPAPVAVPDSPVPKSLGWDWYLDTAGPALGLLAALSGLAAWLRHEDLRITAAALTVGFLAVAWVHIVAALVTALVVVFVGLILSRIG